MSDPATVVLVHGAWHGAWCWERLVDELAGRGVPSIAVDLPGHGASTGPLGDLYGDAAEVAATLDRVDGPAVLVGHSYGGAVTTVAAAGRRDVARLVYVTAFMLDAGEVVMDLARRPPEPGEIGLLGAAVRPRADGTAVLDPEACVPALYHDCDPATQAWAVDHLGPQPLVTFTQPVEVAAWRSIPSTYVVCSADRGVLPSHQRFMAGRADEVIELDAGHSPFLSRPSELAAALARAAAEAGR
ncbi:MAG: alpha/beta hydrolase [Acidimicrobiales bacterium]|nr:alpha/beta hydrolase [Acidimicrobiales bacterium]